MNKLNKMFLILGMFLIVSAVVVIAELNSSNITSGNETNSTSPNIINSVLNLTVDNTQVISGNIINVNARLTTEDQLPLDNQNITFYIGNETIGVITTDAQGDANTPVDTSNTQPGTYMISAEYYGSDTYSVSIDYKQITIEENARITLPTQNTLTNNELTNPINSGNLPNGVQRVEDCKDEKYTVQEAIYGQCSVMRNICDDEPLNTSCHEVNVTYQCQTGTRDVEKNNHNCKITGYLIDRYRINSEDYACSAAKDGNTISLICDSKYDGNGDGICTSGESCMQFVIENHIARKYQKNSRDDFIESDDTYFLNEATMEVVQ